MTRAMPILQFMNMKTAPAIINSPVITLSSAFGPRGNTCKSVTIINKIIDIFQLKKIKTIASIDRIYFIRF